MPAEPDGVLLQIKWSEPAEPYPSGERIELEATDGAPVPFEVVTDDGVKATLRPLADVVAVTPDSVTLRRRGEA